MSGLENTPIISTCLTETSDGRQVRVLQVGATYQSAMYLDDPCELVFDYHEGFAALLNSSYKHIALIGGGAFSFPKYVLKNYPAITLVVAETDAEIIDLAHSEFALDEVCRQYDPQSKRLHIYQGDGLELLQTGELFDVIYNDAFMEETPVWSLLEEAGVRRIADVLTAHGLYVINCVSALRGRHSKTLQRTLGGLRAMFGYISILPYGLEDPFEPDNCVIVASRVPLEALSKDFYDLKELGL